MKKATDSKPSRQQALIRSSAAEYLTFVAASGTGGVEAVYADENIWLTQKMMGVLYDVDVRTINYHLKKIFGDSELEEESVIRNFRITAAAGKRPSCGPGSGGQATGTCTEPGFPKFPRSPKAPCQPAICVPSGRAVEVCRGVQSSQNHGTEGGCQTASPAACYAAAGKSATPVAGGDCGRVDPTRWSCQSEPRESRSRGGQRVFGQGVPDHLSWPPGHSRHPGAGIAAVPWPSGRNSDHIGLCLCRQQRFAKHHPQRQPGCRDSSAGRYGATWIPHPAPKLMEVLS